MPDDQDQKPGILSQVGSAIGRALESGPAISKAPQEGVEPESDPFTDLAGGAVAAKLGEGAADILGNEIGSIGKNIMAPEEYRAAVNKALLGDPQAKLQVAAHEAQHRLMSGEGLPSQPVNISSGSQKPIYSAAEAMAANEGKAEEPGLAERIRAKSMQQLSGPSQKPVFTSADALKKNYPQGYADGGVVGGESPDFISDDQMAAHSPTMGTETPDFIPDDQFKSDEERHEERYGSLGQQALTAAESGAKGLLGPIAPGVETALGVNPEDIREREAENPAIAGTSEAVGFVAPALASLGAGAAAKMGLTAAAKAIPTLAKVSQLGALDAITAKLGLTAGETLASKIGVTAAKGAIDNMLLTGSDEASRMILKDPLQSSETAISDIGLSGVIGAALGGGLGAAGHLFQATVGDKAAKLAADFQGRLNEHMTNPNPVASMTTELSDLHNQITGLADEVYGAEGLKSKDIAKALPEMNNKILNQSGEITEKLENAAQKLAKDDHVGLLETEIGKYKQAIQSNEPEKIFNATQDLKKQLQEWGKFDKDAPGALKERPFRNASKDLAYDLRTSLEDTSVWGKAAERQQAINKAFSEYYPALKDFRSTFMTKVGGDYTMNPAKVETYLNQLGKSSAEIKQAKLQNFVDATNKYKKVIGDSHVNLGMESPITHTPMAITMASLGEKTLGSKLADAFISKGLTDAGSKTLGGAIVGGLAHIMGAHSGIGAIIGAHTLGPFFKSVLPGIAKALLHNPANAQGFRAAAEYGAAVVKGELASTKAVKALFKKGVSVLSESQIPTDKEKDKLNKQLQTLQVNPDKLFEAKDHLQHYLPDHSMAQQETLGNIITHLNAIRASQDKQAPLDSKPVLSTTQKAQYNRALEIAQQPLVVMEAIKNGTITANDINNLGSMYPALYNGLKEKILSEMTDFMNKDGVVPYKTRIGLSMFLAQPLDSTMSPMSIMAAQPIPKQPPMPQQGKTKGSKSSPALQKMSQGYATPGQAREAHRQAKP
jgi:hypothetical protein